jgi:DNA-binding NtrC family response regulator
MKKTIQIVEDDPDLRFILQYILDDPGLELEMFDCIHAFSNRKHEADLFILDVRLPDGSGIELSQMLKSSASTSNIPVMIMSAHARAESALQQGRADYFIDKPFDLEDFVSKVKNILTSGTQNFNNI